MAPLSFDECMKWISGVCADPKTSANGDAYYVSHDDLYIVIVRIWNGGEGFVDFLPRKESMDKLFVDRMNKLLTDWDGATDNVDIIEELCDGFMVVHGYEYGLHEGWQDR
jgi:hypothetical protein